LSGETNGFPLIRGNARGFSGEETSPLTPNPSPKLKFWRGEAPTYVETGVR